MTAIPALRARFTRAGAVRYAGAATDFNPIHYSPRHAEALGLPGVLAHGMWTMGVGLRLVTDYVGDPGRVLSYSVRFTKPVVLPDDDDGVEVLFEGEIVAATETTETIAITATCGDDQVLGAAKATVRR